MTKQLEKLYREKERLEEALLEEKEELEFQREEFNFNLDDLKYLVSEVTRKETLSDSGYLDNILSDIESLARDCSMDNDDIERAEKEILRIKGLISKIKEKIKKLKNK